MHNIPNHIADVLLQLEATLRIHGRWDRQQPPTEALDCRAPFCIDTLRFEQWLQWIFLPRMKTILEDGKPLPQQSAILAYAELCLHKDDPPTTDLLETIRRFDELIAIHSAARHH